MALETENLNPSDRNKSDYQKSALNAILVNADLKPSSGFKMKFSGSEKLLVKFLTSLENTPDLSDSVVPVLKPALLRSYSLISGKYKNTFTPTSRHKVENILVRDFPKLLATYQKIPLDTRNESVLENGKTYRQNLLESFAYLIAKLREIEETELESLNQETRINDQIMHEYYGNLQSDSSDDESLITRHLPENEKTAIHDIVSKFSPFSWQSIKNGVMAKQQQSIEKKLQKAVLKTLNEEKIKSEEDSSKKENSYGFKDYLLSFDCMSLMMLVMPIMLISLIITSLVSNQKNAHMKVQQEEKQTMMLQGLSHIFSTISMSNTVEEDKKALANMQDIKSKDYVPDMTWSYDKTDNNFHIVINHFSASSCNSAIHALPADEYDIPSNMTYSNVSLNHQPLHLQVADNKRDETAKACKNDNLLEFNIKAKGV
jgi:hypothetical protein